MRVAVINIQTTILIIHTLIALAIIVLVLLQRGKGAEAGAAFGAGASGTVFGARGSTNFFSRTTAILATAFFASSLTLAYLSSQRTDRPESLIESMPAVEVEQAPREDDIDAIVPALPEGDDAGTSGEADASTADVPPLVEEAPDSEPVPEE